MSLLNFGFHPVGLHHGELAASGSDAQFSEGHGLGDAANQPTQAVPWAIRIVKMAATPQYEEHVTFLGAADL